MEAHQLQAMLDNMQENLKQTIQDTIKNETKELYKKLEVITDKKIPKIEKDISTNKHQTNLIREDLERQESENQ